MKPAKFYGKSLGQLLPQVLQPALKAHGMASAQLIAHWDDLVGARFAPVTRPMRVSWPRRAELAPVDRPPDPATLVVRCESAHALEFQHAVDGILERINALYGWRAIGKISLRQGPVRDVAPLKPRDPFAPLTQKIAATLDSVEDENLRAALSRLGQGVLGAHKKPQ